MKGRVDPVVESGYTYVQLFPVVRSTLEAGISVLLLGPPGVGKSSLAVDLARAMKLRLIDIRLAQKDPAELGGVYFPNRDTRTLELFPPEWVKVACSEPCLVFLDEFNAAVTKLHQAAAYQITLDRVVGEHKLPENCIVIAAGNRTTDKSVAFKMPKALSIIL